MAAAGFFASALDGQLFEYHQRVEVGQARRSSNLACQALECGDLSPLSFPTTAKPRPTLEFYMVCVDGQISGKA
jgi:hypothetical protein